MATVAIQPPFEPMERWLIDTLGLNELEAHNDAHRLEHVLSQQVEGRLAEFLEKSTTRELQGAEKEP